ncbi:MAG TPA: TIGR03619 family F420-dependent LLM class oxidoreductase [Acidimicrobiales bacterium]|nr:TIGR03619 family F420-dependent LLM class oxidoreductase [Acidimicrobiales bacterium]
MRFTVSLPFTPADHLLPIARAAEAAGWDAISVPDSVFFPEHVSAGYPYTADGQRFWPADAPWPDPWVAIPAMAAVTERLSFYTNVLKVGIREPLLVAKTVTSTAAMFEGRIGIGVGLSWIPEEFAWLGQEMKTRGKRLDEAIEILRACLAGGWVEHHGRHYDFDRLMMAPAPSEPVPLYVGGHSEPALKRAARLGDGWIAVQVTPEEIAETVPKLHAYRDEYGTADRPFEIKVTPLVMPTIEAMDELAALGVTDVITVPWYFYGGDPESLDTKLADLARFADEIIAPIRARA